MIRMIIIKKRRYECDLKNKKKKKKGLQKFLVK